MDWLTLQLFRRIIKNDPEAAQSVVMVSLEEGDVKKWDSEKIQHGRKIVSDISIVI